MKRAIKMAAAALALIPFTLLGLEVTGVLSRGFMSNLAMILNLPVVSVMSLVAMFHLGAALNLIIGICLALGWTSLIAALFWKAASDALGENEPDGKFDWIAFQVRFVFGAVIGMLLGWRFWIKAYNWASLPVCLIVGALICGLALGLGWREDFWGRGF